MTSYQRISEDEWEQMAMETLGELGWEPKRGAAIAPGSGERDSWSDLVINSRFLDALRKLNPSVPADVLHQAMADILTPRSQDAITENQRVHQWIVSGYRGLSWTDQDGVEQNPTLRLISADWAENDWLAVNQVTIHDRDQERRFDIVLYVNGLPVSILELKRAGSASADVDGAIAQLDTYLREFPMAFRFVVFTVASDGLLGSYGTPFTPSHHFSPWKVDDDGRPVEFSDEVDGDYQSRLEVLLHGVANQERFLQLQRDFVAFDEGAGGLAKRIAKPHQYFAVTKAVATTVQAVESNGKAGVVWHTQGSGKSMEMELYAARVAREPKLLNPTIVVITDRTELDQQLFDSFQQSTLLADKPRMVASRGKLRDELTQRVTGGIYFTTLQKFSRTEDEARAGAEHPQLSDRRNIILIVDEAHRSHYGGLDSYARHLKRALPHATMIAFTGTPISFDDRNTREVFGDYIDIYDLSRAVDDGATVPVYFEQRLVKVNLAEGVTQQDLDAAADELTEGLDEVERARVEQSVAVVNAVYGAPERLAALAEDLVAHWEQRSAAMRPFVDGPGKAIVVGATRDICARLYTAIVAVRPDWHSDDDATGKIKVVYSGTPKDKVPVAEHVRRPSQMAAIKNRLKVADDELEIVIVKDMMLTGFDAPPLHTLYLDRALKGALLMQTLARVNRTFRGKEGGLLVAYAALAENLKVAVAAYSQRDQDEEPMGRDTREEIEPTIELVAAIDQLVAGYDWRFKLGDRSSRGDPKARYNVACGLVNHVRSPETPGNQVDEDEETLGDAFRRLTRLLGRAWALCSNHPDVQAVEGAIRFYEEVRVWIAKLDAEDRKSRGEPIPEDIARLLSQVIATSTAAGGILDIYEAAGMPKPSLLDLGPAFVEKTQEAPHPAIAVEALRALVQEESAKATATNALRQRAFSERIDDVMRKYTNQQLTSAQVIAELVELAKDVVAEASRGQHFDPPLDEDQLAFFDAVATNESAVDVMGEGMLAAISRDLVAVMQRDVRTDWTVRDDVRAKMRTSIKRLLVKHGYPPDKQPGAIKLVMEQMEMMAPRYSQRRRQQQVG